MSKIRIHIPFNCQEEVKYTFHCLLSKFLGFEIEFLTSTDSKDFLIEGKKGFNLKIENHFFHSDIPSDLYTKSRIPKKVEKSTLNFLEIDFDHVSLFGKPELKFDNGDFQLKSDIISSTFFMLSRWEEMIYQGEMDRHERFPLEYSLAYKNGFYNRPIVNEYLDLLSTILGELGWPPTHARTYKAVISYDIDMIQKWKGIKPFLQSVYSNLRGFKLARIVADKLNYFGNIIGLSKDPFDSFDFILDSLKGRDLEAILYFKSGASHPKFDKNNYSVSSSKIQNVFEKLNEAKVKIGLHPSYHTFKDQSLMAQEYETLNISIPNSTLNLCRQHYLRFSVPETWGIMEDCGFKNDSSMVYSKEPGFRCGICYTFPVYDCKNRKMLNLEESPLIFMETPFLEKDEQILSKVRELSNSIKKHRGENIVLWHNNNLFYKEHRRTYKKVLDIISPD